VIELSQDKPGNLSHVQKAVDSWINQFEEGYWPPLSMLAAVIEEIGELAREINDREGYKKKRVSNNNSLEMELGDAIYSLVCIANYYQIDLDKAFSAALEKYTKRDMNRWTRKSKTANHAK
jgi:NTP pyrophosphatase (non-canonical NTP hydrolase)